jgi:hypothetical protein
MAAMAPCASAHSSRVIAPHGFTSLHFSPHGRCYWWHEVITEPSDAATDELTVSLNFWFTPVNRMLQPALPLSPFLRVELGRQLEFLICDALHDAPNLVPPFCAALAKQLDALHAGCCDGRAADALGALGGGPVPKQSAGLWHELDAARPAQVSRATWEGLFEYVAAKLTHLIGARQALPFVADLLHAERFATLKTKAGAPYYVSAAA